MRNFCSLTVSWNKIPSARCATGRGKNMFELEKNCELQAVGKLDLKDEEFTVMPSLKPVLWFTFQLCRGWTRPCWQSCTTTKHSMQPKSIVEPDLEYCIINNLSWLMTLWICYRWNSGIYDLPKIFNSLTDPEWRSAAFSHDFSNTWVWFV